MNTFDLPVVRWCMLHVANGDLFYIALVLLTLATALRLAASWRAMYRWRHVLALLTGVGCFALILAASSLTLAWLVYLGLLAVGACLHRPQRRLRLAVAALAMAAGIFSLVQTIHYEAGPDPLNTDDSTQPDFDQVVGIGDVFNRVVTPERTEAWPLRLKPLIHRDTASYAFADTSVADIDRYLSTRPIHNTLIILAVGAHDMLFGQSLTDYRNGLSALLTRLTADNRVIMIEIPVPLARPWYGWVQRSIAEQHDVALIPRRVIADVLFAVPGATAEDGLHLTPAGHQRLAESLAAYLTP
ncbi:hypothetical protein HED60_04030 [Planctomycetales bacterium ZRK34]|nr:hypothetical protein HED60_04030 [Planctomycetales bacterium ZRK34]